MLGFFEVIVWLLAIGQIMQHLDNFLCYIAYGLGFATGNYWGLFSRRKCRWHRTDQGGSEI